MVEKERTGLRAADVNGLATVREHAAMALPFARVAEKGQPQLQKLALMTAPQTPPESAIVDKTL